MKKLITIVLSVMLLVGCSSTKEPQIDNEQKYNLINNIESLEIDSNWNIPVEGKISGIFCGFIDNHSFELLGEDGNYIKITCVQYTCTLICNGKLDSFLLSLISINVFAKLDDLG